MEETLTNEQLALACQAGDKQAIAQLWEQTKAFIFRWCYHYYQRGRDRCAACGVELADLQQEGFLALLDAVQAFQIEKEYKFISWLKFPLKNRCSALLGTRGNTAPRLLNQCGSLDEAIGEDEDTSRLDMIADPNAGEGFESVEDREYNRQLHEALQEAMDTLQEKHRDILQWRYYDGLTLQQCGERMQCSPEYTRQLNRQALTRMRSGQPLRILRRFLGETSQAYTGTGFQAWKNGGSVQERIAERVERKLHPYPTFYPYADHVGTKGTIRHNKENGSKPE